MKYAEFTRNTTDPFKKITHGSRLAGALELVPLRPEMKVLDYGCGDGGFFDELSTKVPVENLFGFDPYLLSEMEFVGANTYDDMGLLVATHPDTFDVIYCMEVCEHLNDAALHALFENIRTVGKTDATFVFGVPLETGIPGFVKNVYRVLKGGRQRATIAKTLKSLLTIPIPRAHDQHGWIGSHIGFDYKYLLEMLDYGGFEAIGTSYLPFPKLGCHLNNEIYFICKRNDRYNSVVTAS